MDHLASLRPDSQRLRRVSGPSPPSSRSPSTSPPPSLRLESPFSLQTRRLQLRNAGFRGAQLSTRKISDHLAAAYRSPSWGSPDLGSDKENSPQSTILVSSASRNSSSRRSVLQESHGSIHRGQQQQQQQQQQQRHPARPSVTDLFNNNNNNNNDDNHGSPYETISQPYILPNIPARFDGSLICEDPTATDTRDHSYSSDSPLLQTSPPILHGKRKDPRRPKASYETIKYIEHLEAQLESHMENSKPSPTRPTHLAKMRALTAEVKALKQEIAEWKARFDARVVEEMEKHEEKIQALESQAEMDQSRIRELEYENEMQATKLRNADALSLTNANLERRVDVLTELLAQSPSRLDPIRSPGRGSNPWSPDRAGQRQQQRLPRPKSMMPSIPLSPSQPLVLPEYSIPDVTTTQEDTCESIHSCSQETDSSGAASVSLATSQRSSMTSQSSSLFSSVASLPFHITPEYQAKIRNRVRKMRRFPSGSSTLRPLILPAAAVSHVTADEQSIVVDPAVFLEQELPPSSELPSEDAHLWAYDESLAALEGRAPFYHSFEEVQDVQTTGYESPGPMRGLGLELEEPFPRYGTIAEEIDGSFFDESDEDGEEQQEQHEGSPDEIYQPTHGYCTTTPTKQRRSLYAGSCGSPAHSTHTPTQSPTSTWPPEPSQTPRELVRCILRNAWRSRSRSTCLTKLGRLPWWMLGLIWRREDQPKTMIINNNNKNKESETGHVTADTGLGLDPGLGALRKSLSLWAKFSLALVLAIGIAVKEGPANLMESPTDPVKPTEHSSSTTCTDCTDCNDCTATKPQITNYCSLGSNNRNNWSWAFLAPTLTLGSLLLG
ncbi:hypothetical protein ASPZODRAFT_141262 [Penicilliopsis zonata CBS 506.65]|uniref:Uncharacterized protein n=1 Tax=Penicilliopsis zonata CBS 506.65 TaxID=1073090 RepID=A0A1L9SKJ5_9EURO|nr:hypothetical protein ASPZODRAFT_141262 [Penicilliopsis zonata CBS 506.65]OJJ47687.1 hypothetical protein ASPZODRAFT_141262 [Penicilliopsis zonata CBS 506.65]